MKNSFWNRRFPTLVGLLFITLSMGMLMYVPELPHLFRIGAREPLLIQNVLISNQAERSVSISFRTKEAILAQLSFGPTLESATTLFDERDEIGREAGAYRIHHFTAKNLSTGQTYVFNIHAQSTTFDNNGEGFKVKTAYSRPSSFTGEPPFIEPVRGRVLDAQGTGVKDALVFVKIDGAALTSAVIKSEGAFLVPLSGLYTSDLTGPYTFNGNEIVTVEIIGSEDIQSIIKVPFGEHTDLPTITLGENADLTEPATPETSGFRIKTTENSSEGKHSQEDIITPQDGAFFIDHKPLFRGKGTPSQKIAITIESEPMKTQLFVDSYGSWIYQPDTPLPPGTHTITVSFFNGDVVAKVVKRQFEIFASGSTVLETATASPTVVAVLIPTPTPTPTVKPTATLTPIPQVTPTAALTPTPLLTMTPLPSTPPKITPSPKLTPTATVIPTPTVVSVPTAGTALPGILMLGTGLLLTIVGFLTRYP